MSDGLSQLDQKIQRFEELLDQLKEATREGHELLKATRNERREVERLLSSNVKDMVDRRVEAVVVKELEIITPRLKSQSDLIYDRVTNQVDKLIDLAMGKEFSESHDRADLRPILAQKLKLWIREIIISEGLDVSVMGLEE